MAVILCDIMPGDEVILPSFTFVSAANAVVLRGGTPVFVDCREDNMNIDAALVEKAITARTKAVIVMHYAGVSCDMDSIMGLAELHDLVVIEDAAHCIDAYHEGRHLGARGHLSTFSFHHTKNIHCGEGGGLLVNDSRYLERAYILRDKGTNRQSFLQGQTKKYSWVDVGSSYSLSELSAAYLLPQLRAAKAITEQRRALWEHYQRGLQLFGLECEHGLESDHNAHICYILLQSLEERERTVAAFHQSGIDARFHYVPLHSSPFGKKYKYVSETDRTTSLADRLLRLPIYHDMTLAQVSYVLDALAQIRSV